MGLLSEAAINVPPIKVLKTVCGIWSIVNQLLEEFGGSVAVFVNGGFVLYIYGLICYSKAVYTSNIVMV